MRHLSRVAAIASAAALLSLCAGSFAQGAITWKLQCQDVGNGAQEPLGDREGHAVSVGQYTCRAEGGPLDGAVLTGNGVWEWDKTNAEARAGGGVYRKPGAMVVYQYSDGKVALSMADGKVTGWNSTVHGTYKLATGSAAMLTGKAWTASARSTGAGQFMVDVKVE